MNLLHSHVAATCLKIKPENVYPKNERKKKKTKLFHKLHSTTHNIIMAFQKYTSVALLLIK